MDFASQLIEFVNNHWALSLAFMLVLSLLIGSEIRRRLYGAAQAGPHAATLLMNQGAKVVDVREAAEYQQGHIANAIHIPLSQLDKRLSELEAHRDTPILTYCRTGSRSNAAASRLKQNGFNKVHNLAGGIVAWQNANLPLTKK